MSESSADFYAGLAPLYHLIYADWGASVSRQAAQLDSIVRDVWGESVSSVLDVACGIGTQALGLASLEYRVTASDVSPAAVDRARAEAGARGLTISLSVADMRAAHDHHSREFDLVICGDNSLPHLPTAADVLTALRQFRACCRPGGGCLISVRDYEREDLSTRQVRPGVVHVVDGVRWIVFQVWEPRGAAYELTQYFVEDRGGGECRTLAFRTVYHPIAIERLLDLMREAGFADARRIDGRFFQPVLVGRAPR